MRPTGITRPGPQRRGSPRPAGLGGPGGGPRGGLGAQGGQVLFDTGVADQPSGVLGDELLASLFQQAFLLGAALGQNQDVLTGSIALGFDTLSMQHLGD